MRQSFPDHSRSFTPAAIVTHLAAVVNLQAAPPFPSDHDLSVAIAELYLPKPAGQQRQSSGELSSRDSPRTAGLDTGTDNRETPQRQVVLESRRGFPRRLNLAPSDMIPGVLLKPGSKC